MYYSEKGHFMLNYLGQPCCYFKEWINELISKGLVHDGSHKQKKIMQYTGRKDKTGVDMCENDIVKCNHLCEGKPLVGELQ